MARIIWRYTMSTSEQRLWRSDGTAGWCRAFEACVEDDAREQGSKKYVIYDRRGDVVAKSEVSPLPEPRVY